MEQSSLFRFSIDNAIEIAVVYDDSGTILYANQVACQSLEYYDELCGTLITEIFPAEFTLKDGVLEHTCQTDGEFQSMMAYRKNRTCFAVRAKILIHNQAAQMFAKPGHRADDPPLYGGQRAYVCLAYDATKENYMEKKVTTTEREMEAALKVKSEFVANVTHELRTPVNGILGNTRELISREDGKEKLKYLNMIERGCRDMNAIINNILDFSKLEAGKFTLENREFEFRNMIEYVRSNHAPRIIEKGLDFSISVAPNIPEFIVGDELRIVQLLNNLISNAYKFTSVGGIHVEVVKTAQEQDRMELFFMVIDSGIGISKADQDKLFQSFSQVDASISRKYGGTGLGLNICKQLVELMGGDINVESTVGKGSTFSFQIWVETTEEDSRTEGAEGAGERQPGAFMVTEQTEQQDEQGILEKLQRLTENHVSDRIWEYGTEENAAEVEKKMSKLILSVEMENWEKAEMFADAVKQLLEGAPREIKSAALRMKMAVQKGDYDKATAAFEVLQNNL